ncbi:MAG: hypothetical protein RL641_661 [Candidatus Parcubacteria bacterium]
MTQAQALAIMKTGVNVYLTGSAGSGKTYLLNQYISYLKKHNIAVAVTASTGIAATHMHGMTIHSWAGIGIKEKITKYDFEDMDEKKYLWNRFSTARVLIIDEVSMLHAHRLDMVDQVCQKFKRNNLPFGGLQVILSGDLFQLPPINKTGELAPKDMVIYSNAWQTMAPAICYITEQHRQEDDTFLSILNAIRDDKIDESHYALLATRHNAEIGKTNPTKLYTHNKNVDFENNTALSAITSPTHTYAMSSRGNDVIVDILKKSCLAQSELHLKKGAEVMFIKNNIEEGYVNGTRGIVSAFAGDGSPIVTTMDGRKITVVNETWAIEENGKVKAEISQLPLRLAWAITIHKSQGMSMDSAEIDLSNAFAYGMGYVALSRVRTLSGIRLVGFSPDALKVDPTVLAFDRELRQESKDNEAMFGKLNVEAQKKLESEFIVRMGGTLQASKKFERDPLTGLKKVENISTGELTKELLGKKMSLADIAKERKLTLGTIFNHVEQLKKQYPHIDLSHIKPSQKNIDAVKKENHKLKADEKGKLASLKFALTKAGKDMTYEEMRLVRLFL